MPTSMKKAVLSPILKKQDLNLIIKFQVCYRSKLEKASLSCALVEQVKGRFC